MIDLKKLGKYILDHIKVLVFTGLIMMLIAGAYVMVMEPVLSPPGDAHVRTLIVVLLKYQIIGAAFGAILATLYLTAKFCFLEVVEKIKSKKRKKDAAGE